MIIARPEAISTDNFAISWYNLLSGNARLDTKIDIVNPIPARIVTPISTSQFTFVASRTILNLVSRYTARDIPNGFPKNKPKITPIDSGDMSPAIEEEEIIILVLASAKIGIIKKLTGKLILFSKAGILLTGRINASIIPAKEA